MKKNDSKKDMVPGSNSEFKHFTMILMEKMDSTVKTVTEQYGSLTKKIDVIGSDVSKLKEDMAIVLNVFSYSAGSMPTNPTA